MKQLLIAIVLVLAGRAEAQCNSTSTSASCGSVTETVCEDVSTQTTTCSIGSCTCDSCDPTCVENCAEAACAGGGSGGGSSGTTPPACSTPLCGGDCCSGSQSCCGGSCCDGDCCGGTCVASGGTCCGSTACYGSDQCCSDSCVASGGNCCGSAACYGGDQCCNGECVSAVGPCCGSGACNDGQQCCNGQCTSTSDVCCPDGTICPAGQSCPSGGGGGNCGLPSGATNCGGSYCPQVEACMAATPGLVSGSFVCIDGIACGSGFCPSADTCDNGACLAPGLFVCGSGYCNGNSGQQCCGGGCISSSQTCCSQGGVNWVCNNGLSCQSCNVNNQNVYSCGACPGGTAAQQPGTPTQGSAPLGPDAGTPATPLSPPVTGSSPTPGTAPSNGGGGAGLGTGSWLGLGFSCGGGSGSGGGGSCTRLEDGGVVGDCSDGGPGKFQNGDGGPVACARGTMTVSSNASTAGAVVGSLSESAFNSSADDAGSFAFTAVTIVYDGGVALPAGSPTATYPVAFSSSRGSGFFKVEFILPAAAAASLQGAATIESTGRVFLNDIPLTPAIGGLPVGGTSSLTFSASEGFVAGNNTLEISDYAPSGPSGVAFYFNVTFDQNCTTEADEPAPPRGLFAEKTFLLFGLAAFAHRRKRPSGAWASPQR